MTATAIGLRAAVLLAFGRNDGVAALDTAPQEAKAVAARSFWAAPLSLPIFAGLHMLDWMQSGTPPEPWHGFLLDLLGYAIGWAGFALLSRNLATMLGRAGRWPRFLTLWNWCNFVQYLMLSAAALPSLLGLPDLLSQSTWLIAMGWALWLEWFATRAALDIPGLQAAGIVALDVALGLFIVGLTSSVS